MPFLKINTPPAPDVPPHRCVTPGGNYDGLVGVGSLYQCPICAIVWRKEGLAHWADWELDAMPGDFKALPDPLAARGSISIDEIARAMEEYRFGRGWIA